jgi:hypothetical protein
MPCGVQAFSRPSSGFRWHRVIKGALAANVSAKLIRQAVDDAIDEPEKEDRGNLIALMRGEALGSRWSL